MTHPPESKADMQYSIRAYYWAKLVVNLMSSITVSILQVYKCICHQKLVIRRKFQKDGSEYKLPVCHKIMAGRGR